MKRNASKTRFRQIAILSITALMGFGMSACSTSASLSAGAPIIYKGDTGQLQQATVTRPYSSPSIAPRVKTPMPYIPAPVEPKAAQPRAVQPEAPSVIPHISAPSARSGAARPTPAPQQKIAGIDQSTVDRTLSAYQRIGKPYTVMGKNYTPRHQPNYDVTGTASWYGDKFHGKLTASGEVYDMNAISAAHKTLPLNSMVYVTNLENGKGMYVRINDRGPFIGNRIIDLSRETARELGLFNSGLGKVRVQYAGPADPSTINKPDVPRFAPVAPRKKPEVSAEAENYQPLRALPSEPKRFPQAAQPVNPIAPYSAPHGNPLLDALPQSQGLQQQMPAAPALPPRPDSDAPTTLTIKGPIHLAVDKVAIGQQTGEFIPAVNYRIMPSK